MGLLGHEYRWRELPWPVPRTREIPPRLIPSDVLPKLVGGPWPPMVRIRGDLFATSWWFKGDEISGVEVILARDHPHLGRFHPDLPKAVKNLYTKSIRVAAKRATDAGDFGRRLAHAERSLAKYSGPIYAN